MPTSPIRVLIIDDSVFIRSALKGALEKTLGMDAVGTAQNGNEGLDKILRLRPDVVTLDVEMPGMTGLQDLEEVMKRQLLPVVMVSMTGMGCDGAAGIRILKRRGARTLAQDKETSIVCGMPKAAFETGCIDQVVSLDDIPSAIAEAVKSVDLVPST